MLRPSGAILRTSCPQNAGGGRAAASAKQVDGIKAECAAVASVGGAHRTHLWGRFVGPIGEERLARSFRTRCPETLGGTVSPTTHQRCPGA